MTISLQKNIRNSNLCANDQSSRQVNDDLIDVQKNCKPGGKKAKRKKKADDALASKSNVLKTRIKDVVRTNTNAMLKIKSDQSSNHSLRNTVTKRS